jgi:chromosome segregation ATPase
MNEQWTPITERIEDLIQKEKSVNELKSQNECLQKRIKALLEDDSKEQKPPPQNDVQLRKAHAELEKRNKLLNTFRYRLALGQKIEALCRLLCDDVEDLHASIYGVRVVSARPVVLAAIFARRLIPRGKKPLTNDIDSLMVFTGRESVSSQLKLRQIREGFTSLSQNLLIAKQTTLEARQSSAKLQKELNESQASLASGSVENESVRKKMAFLKGRMSELQKELTSLISPEGYEEALTAAKVSQARSRTLEAKINKLEKEIAERTEIARTMAAQIHSMELAVEDQSESAERAKSENAEKDREIENLRALLRDKTKEVLALERLVHAYKEKGTAADLTINCLAAELQTQFNNDGDDPVVEERPINPAFLGK